MNKQTKPLTLPGARRRYHRILRTVKQLGKELQEVEDRLPEPSLEEYNDLRATPDSRLTDAAHLFPLLRLVRLDLEDLCTMARRNANCWCAEDFDDLECTFNEMMATRNENQLRALMSSLCQEATGEPWVAGLEFDVWAAVHDQEVSSLRLTDEQKAELRRLTELTSWFFVDRRKTMHFLGDDVWEAKYAAWRAARQPLGSQD